MENVYSIKKKSNKPLEIDAQQRVSVQATVKHRQFILFKPGCYFCWAQLSFFVSQVVWVKRSEPINAFLLGVLRLPVHAARRQASFKLLLINSSKFSRRIETRYP